MAQLDNLFRVKEKVDVLGMAVWVRTLSDFDLHARDEHALLASAGKRNALEDPHTPDYDSRIRWLHSTTDEQLGRAVMYLIDAVDTAELTRQAIEEIQPDLIPFPDKADDKERADVLKQREQGIARVEAERRAYIDAHLKERKQAVEGKPRETLLAIAKSKQIELLCRTESMRAFDSYTIFACAFTDEACETRLCESPQASEQLSPEARKMLTFHYAEVDSINPFALKSGSLTDDSLAGSKPSNDSEPKNTKKRGKSPGTGPTPA
jgi:hypothetical protein